jgi:hypothetical protein
VHHKWNFTATPIVNVKDYPTSYTVKDKFGEVHAQCNHIVLITVKKAGERFNEAVEEERGFVDLFGDRSQSQMSGYSPPQPPLRNEKKEAFQGDVQRRVVDTGWMTTTAERTIMEGTATMVVATTLGGKASKE